MAAESCSVPLGDSSRDYDAPTFPLNYSFDRCKNYRLSHSGGCRPRMSYAYTQKPRPTDEAFKMAGASPTLGRDNLPELYSGRSHELLDVSSILNSGGSDGDRTRNLRRDRPAL